MDKYESVMPIYEYQALRATPSCPKCADCFEWIQGIHDQPLRVCPDCGARVGKIISACHAAVAESSPEQNLAEKKIKEYEQSGRWSHAAELADKQAEKTKDPSLRNRALENYKKAGY